MGFLSPITTIGTSIAFAIMWVRKNHIPEIQRAIQNSQNLPLAMPPVSSISIVTESGAKNAVKNMASGIVNHHLILATNILRITSSGQWIKYSSTQGPIPHIAISTKIQIRHIERDSHHLR